VTFARRQVKYASRPLATAALAVLWLIATPPSEAALIPSLDGSLVYDTDLDITWLADADYARTDVPGSFGFLSWPEAIAWTANLEFAGQTEWRLPRTLVGDPGCAQAVSTGTGCSGSEMGHLFYVELEGVAGEKITTHGNSQSALFSNLDGAGGWSETEVPGSPQAWLFRFNDGIQNVTGNTGTAGLRSWPVHPGNITGVPEPSGGLLLALGAAGLCALRRTRPARGSTCPSWRASWPSFPSP